MWQKIFRKLLIVTLFAIICSSGLLLAQIRENVSLISQSCHQWGYSRNVEVCGNYAFLITDSHCMSIIDITNPANPFETGFINIPEFIEDYAIQGDYVFLACSVGLRIIDISDPHNPFETNCFTTSGSVGRLAISGNYAYLICSRSIKVADISDISQPIIMIHLL